MPSTGNIGVFHRKHLKSLKTSRKEISNKKLIFANILKGDLSTGNFSWPIFESHVSTGKNL